MRSADPERLESWVRELEGERQPFSSPQALAQAEELVATAFSDLGLQVHRSAFVFRDTEYHNVVGRLPARGREPDDDRPRVLLGAHFDTMPDTPGADDNASGVAVMLEAARILSDEELPVDVEFVGFNLEEPQGLGLFRVGSTRFAADAGQRGVRYAGCLILEMVGYTDPAPGSQKVPALLFWKRVPSTGTFLAATGDSASLKLLRGFRRAAATAVPDLDVVTLLTIFRGRLLPQTRLSDNASFWDQGYPALMITDTSFLRNPHYHAATDRIETLDFEFMRKVTDATVAAIRWLADQADPSRNSRRRANRSSER
jgi:Zn-dependent M28 family amino/carboxypeptidase